MSQVINYKRSITNILNIISSCTIIVLLIKNINFIFSDKFNKFVLNSDYFINYTSGFIKRGLDGQIIYIITNITNCSPIVIVKYYYLFIVAVLTLILVYYFFKSKISFFFIFSSFLFLFNFIYFRSLHLSKDLEIIVFSYLVLYLFINRRSSFLVNLFLSIGILVHEEIFIFLFIPLFIIFFLRNCHDNTITRIKKFGLTFLPSILVFLFISSLYNGLNNDIQTIYNSWISFDSRLKGLHFNSGLFDSQPRMIYHQTHLIELKNYIGLGILIIINFFFITCGVFVFARKYFITLKIISLLQMIIILGMCIVASDFGRWFFLSNAVTILIMMILNHRNIQLIDNSVYNFKKEKLLSFYSRFSFSFICVFYLLGGMPYSGFNFYRYFFANPFNVIFKFVIDTAVVI